MKKNVRRLRPKDIEIDIDADFSQTGLESSIEAKIIFRNIVIIETRINPDKWTAFSFEDYVNNCDRVSHNPTNSEKAVLEWLVRGGRSERNPEVKIASRFLSKNIFGKYVITPKFLEVVSKFAKQQ